MKSTKKSLIFSFLSLLLSVAMLIGTTYAWFTDSVTSATNRIQAGNLDVELYHTNGNDTDEKVTDTTLLFDDVEYWEPGAVCYENLTVKNEGSLALVFDIALNAYNYNYVKDDTGNWQTLGSVLKVAAVENGFSGNRADVQGLTFVGFWDFELQEGANLSAGESKTFGIVIYWQPTAEDNTYNLQNGKQSYNYLSTGWEWNSTPLFIDIGIYMTATQYTEEEDSFDNTYDEAALGINIIEPSWSMGEPVVEAMTATGATLTYVADSTVYAEVEVPAGALAGGEVIQENEQLKLYVEPSNTPGGITVGTTESTTTYDVSLVKLVDSGDDVKVTTAEDSTPVKVKLYVGIVELTSFAHNGKAFTEVAGSSALTQKGQYYYEDGYVYFLTNSFSPYTTVYKFAGGLGTEQYPYLIDSADMLQAISDEFDITSVFKYYKVADGVTELDCSGWSSVYMNGSFNGNGVTIKNLDNALFSVVTNYNWDILSVPVTIENFTISDCKIVKGGWTAAVLAKGTAENLTFRDIDITGYIEGSTGVASFMIWGAGYYDSSNGWQHISNYTFENCVSTATTVATSGNAVGFIAHPMAVAGSTITINDSIVTGALSATALDSCKYVSGNSYSGDITETYSEGFLEQYGIAAATELHNTSNGWGYTLAGKKGVVAASAGTAPAVGEAFVENAVEGAVSAKLELIVSPNSKADATHPTEWGCMTGTYLTEDITVNDNVFTSSKIKRYNIQVNPSGATATGVSGNNFNIVNSSLGQTLGADTTVKFVQYDENGVVLQITNYSFGDK